MRALKCFASQTQLDMDVFRQLTELAYRQHLHHNVVASLPAEANCAEMFSIARQVHVAATRPL
ncbi:hypothetical protein STPH1_7473 [Streptomyces sp. OM5714]|nr:hypothetical protein STPH1_7473 [Streptomyces sp. OM5714]